MNNGCSSHHLKVVGFRNLMEFMKKCRKEDQCPVCGAYMSSETMRKTLDGYKAKIKDLEKQLQTEEKRLLNKPTHYLIIAGYHT